MKYLGCCLLLLFAISCTHQQKQPKEKLRFVNDQNDGWNAFSIILRDDSTYKIENFNSDETGKYSIAGNSISLIDKNSNEMKITFSTTALGCIYDAEYISNNRPVAMRVIFDSVFCNHTYDKQLAGKWRYQTTESVSDTLQLNGDGTARFKGKDYRDWDFNNPRLTLTWDNMSEYLFIGNMKEDSLLFSTSWPFDKDDSIRAFRVK